MQCINMRRLFLYFVLNLWYNIAILIGGEHFEPRLNLPIQVKTLPNGFQYVIFRNQKPEGKVFIRLDVNMGSFFEKEGEEGLAHFLEHATFLGSDNFPQGFRKGLGCLGVESTAFTEILYTKYVFDLQKNSAEAIDKTLLAASDIAYGRLTFNEKSLFPEKGVIFSEMGLRGKSYSHLRTAFYRRSEISKKYPLGKRSSIEKATEDQLRRLYIRHYTPNRMFLVVAGDIDNMDEIEDKIKKLFSFQTSNQSPDQNDESFDSHLKKICKNDTDDITPSCPCRFFIGTDALTKNPSFTFGITRFRHEKANSLESRKEDLVLECLITCFKHRIRKLNIDPALTAQEEECQLNIDNTPYDVGYCTISLSYDLKWEDVFQFLCQEWQKLLVEGINENELQEFTTEKRRLQQIEQRNNYKNSGKMVEKIITSHRNKATCLASLEDQLIQLEETLDSLNLDDFKRIHQKEKNGSRIGLFFLISPGLGDSSESYREEAKKLINLFYKKTIDLFSKAPLFSETSKEETSKEGSGKREKIIRIKFPMEELRGEINESFLSEAEQEPIDGLNGEVADLEEIANLGITRFTLTNGIRVNLKPLSEMGKGVSIKLSLGNGKLSYEEGIPELIKYYYDSIDFSDLLKRKGVNFSFQPEINEFSILLSSIDENDTNMMLLFLRKYLEFQESFGDPNHNYLTEDRMNSFKEKLSSAMSVDIKEDPKKFAKTSMLGWITSCRLFGIPSEDDVQKLSNLTNAQFSEILKSLRDSSLEVSIVGSFNRDEIIFSIVKTLGQLPSRGKDPFTIHIPSFTFPEIGSEPVFQVNTGCDQTILVIAFKAPGLRDFKNVTNLKILSKIINERIFEKIRTQEGKTYTPLEYLIDSKFVPYGAICFCIFLDPSNVDEVKTEVLQIISQVEKEGLKEGLNQEDNPKDNQEEFASAKLSHIASVEKFYDSNDGWLDLISSSQRDPFFVENFDFSQNYLQDVSIQDINECAKKFLKDPVFARIKNKQDQTY